MSVVAITSQEICAGLDEFEASTLRKSDWWYVSNEEHMNVWNSTTSLANNNDNNNNNNNPNESLWQAFCNRSIRVIWDMHVHEPENPKQVSNFVKDQTAHQFGKDWTELCLTAPPPMKPIQITIFPDRFPPKMVYTRTFRFSERAKQFYGADVEDELLESAHVRGGLTTDEFGEFIRFFS